MERPVHVIHEEPDRAVTPVAGEGRAEMAGQPAGAVIPGMRRMLWIAAGLVLVEGTVLLAAHQSTARYFSWTIAVPVTAAFSVPATCPRRCWKQQRPGRGAGSGPGSRCRACLPSPR